MHIHGDNLRQKEKSVKKYSDPKSKEFLKEIRKKYDIWKLNNDEIKGPFTKKQSLDESLVQERVEIFSEYKNFLDQQKYAEHFDSRSNLHSSVLEEFMYFLFRDLVTEFSSNALIGKAHTFKDIFFLPQSFTKMVSSPCIRIEKKDHDFAIGANVDALFQVEGSETSENHSLQIPAVAIECKTYLDKTMLEGASTAAEQLKARNPNAIYIVVSEWLKLTSNINLKKFKVDQIYVFRKQKNTDREFRYLPTYEKNPIFHDVVFRLFEQVREHLTSNWEGGVEHGLDRGFLL